MRAIVCSREHLGREVQHPSAFLTHRCLQRLTSIRAVPSDTCHDIAGFLSLWFHRASLGNRGDRNVNGDRDTSSTSALADPLLKTRQRTEEIRFDAQRRRRAEPSIPRQLEVPLSRNSSGSLATLRAIRRFHWSSCFGHVSSNCRAPPLPQGGILSTTLSPVPSFGTRILVS
jgi:hypothetical protein